MLASTVFAPVATAQKAPAPGEVDIQSVKLPPDGPWSITGTIQCTEGDDYQIVAGVFVGAKPGKTQQIAKHLWGYSLEEGPIPDCDCETTGPLPFTLHPPNLSSVPEEFKVWAFALGTVCDFSTGERICNQDLLSKPVKIG